jgi:hypothetical protein
MTGKILFIIVDSLVFNGYWLQWAPTIGLYHSFVDLSDKFDRIFKKLWFCIKLFL